MVGKDHRKAKTGRKAEKRKAADKKKRGVTEQERKQNPKAFAFQSAGKAKAQRARTAEKDQKRLHAPLLEKTTDEPPPFVVLVQGPPGVGKSTLIRCLVKHYTRQNLADVRGPITCVAGKKRRITLVEAPPDLCGLIDAAKYADLVLLLIDGSFGFEMETFEFLNILQVHGFPKVMGVLTHLDSFRDAARLKKTKKRLKQRFWTEIYDGAKLFYLSGIQHGKYLKREVLNLARFISVMKQRPLSWRLAHPYVLADRFEDVTPREVVRANPKADREVVLYGYLRGTNMKPNLRVHIAGVGDFTPQELDALPDPCPLPESVKRRGLNERERLLYAPMADVGGLLYDKDAVYIDIPDWKVQFSRTPVDGELADEGQAMVRQLQATQRPVDEALQAGRIRLFPGGHTISGADAGSDSEDDDGEDEDDSGSEGSLKDDDEDGSSDSDGDEDEDEDGPAAHKVMRRGMPHAAPVSMNGRARRAAVFGDASVPVQRPNSEDMDDADEEDDEAYEDQPRKRQRREQGQERRAASGLDDDEDSDDVSEGLGAAARWKSSMAAHTASVFAERSSDMAAFVYGKRAVANATGEDDEDEDEGGMHGGAGLGNVEDEERDNGDEGGDDFFRIKRAGGTPAQGPKAASLEAVDALDTSRVLLGAEALAAWQGQDGQALLASLRNRFVTGDWAEGERRAAVRPQDDDGGDASGDDGGSGDEAFGDFEDLETGEKFSSGDAVTAVAQRAIAEAKAEELRQAKIAKRAAFDAAYDGDDDAGADAEEAPSAGGKKAPKGPAKDTPAAEVTFYDAVKQEMVARQAATKAMLDSLDPFTRLAMEGHRPGAYVRMRFSGVPCELVQHHDPRRPLLIGGLGQGEEKLGMMRIRFKRHRWFPKLLKCRDPLVFSVGWRRFQSVPVYAVEDHNRRLRMLKYSPEHMHCVATVFGPLAPPNSGIVAVQSLASDVSGWRIAATGVVTELDADMRVVKKLKLVGTPFKIHRHTAFVGGMFNSALEVAKFEGASIRTVSGIRGTIKKALRAGVEGGKDGSFRATFEDKPLLSDIVFLRAWVALDLPRFYNPVTNLLAAAQQQQRAPKPGRRSAQEEEEQAADGAAAAALATVPVAAAAPALTAAAQVSSAEFQPAPQFMGRRPGMVFRTGMHGLGYYKDVGPAGAAAATAAAKATAASTAGPSAATLADGTTAPLQSGSNGWVGARTVAQLRRELGVGAPRESDSLYRQIERAPRKFNPLKVPKALQAALPFASKPKLEPALKNKTLEQKRAVVLEKDEKKAYTLLQQLNAIRNEKSRKRRTQSERRREEHGKKVAVQEAWRTQHNKEERKKRYREEGKAEKRKLLGGKFASGGKRRKVAEE